MSPPSSTANLFAQLPYGSQPPPYYASYGNAAPQQFAGPYGAGKSGQSRREAVPALPEAERYTLKCSHIPSYHTEADIRAHFEAFGHVVELQVTPMGDGPARGHEGSDAAPTDKKTFNEALIQFLSPQNAKKCFNSPAPVLNNRFIKLVQSHFNIIPPCDMEPLSEDLHQADRELLSRPSVPQVATAGLKKKAHSGLNMYAEGPSNKYRRVAELPAVSTPTKPSVESDATVGSQSATLSSPAAAVAAPSKEDLEMKASFEALKSLRSQQETIWKQKESVLQAQVDKCRQMIEKLDSSEDSDSKRKLLDNLESKIVDLQAQLRTVRQQIEKGFVPEGVAATQAPSSSYHVPYAGQYRGRGGGRHAVHGRGYGGRYYSAVPFRGGGRGRSATTYYRDASEDNDAARSADQTDQQEHLHDN